MYHFKQDQYSKQRGGYSRFLNLYCDHCGEYILLYQKDGPGYLKRLYLDRIIAPENVKKLGRAANLKCVKCKRILGIPSIYEEEKRRIYLLLSFAVIKKVTQGVYPPKIARLSIALLKKNRIIYNN